MYENRFTWIRKDQAQSGSSLRWNAQMAFSTRSRLKRIQNLYCTLTQNIYLKMQINEFSVRLTRFVNCWLYSLFKCHWFDLSKIVIYHILFSLLWIYRTFFVFLSLFLVFFIKPFSGHPIQLFVYRKLFRSIICPADDER